MNNHDIRAALDELIKNNRTFHQDLESRLDDVETALARPQRVPGDGGFGTGDLAAARKAIGAFVRAGDESGFKNLSVGSDPDGGYITSPVLSNTWTKKIFDASPMRRLARVETITIGDCWEEPVDYSDIGVTWVGERQGRPATDTPQLGNLKVPVNEVYSLQPVTQRLIDDSFIDVGAWLEGKITDKFGRGESEAAVSGDGVLRPKGFLTYPTSSASDATRPYGTLQYVNSGAATAITADALKDMYWTLRAPHRVNASWLMASPTANAIDKLKSGDGSYLFRASMTAGAPPTLLGHPIEFEETMPSVSAGAFAIAFEDWTRGYLIVDKAGVRFLRDPFTDKPNVLIYGYRRVGGGVASSDAIKLMKIAAS
jgi:HK97 family phage major capsid protein